MEKKIRLLLTTDRERLLTEIRDTTFTLDLIDQASGHYELDNKMGSCPHCLQKEVYTIKRQGAEN